MLREHEVTLKDAGLDRGPAIELSGVNKRYETLDATVIAANDVSVKFCPGVSTAVTGPSGSGKSTLLHLVGGLDRPDSGSILVQNSDITSLKGHKLAEYRQTVGFVFQRFHLIPTLTVLDNVMMPVLGGARKRSTAAVRARDLLQHVGLGGRVNSMATRLSGGQQQRVALVRALINEPKLVIADEPTGNLDSTSSEEVERLLLELPQTHEVTLLIATHDRSFAERCDRTVHVVDGCIASVSQH